MRLCKATLGEGATAAVPGPPTTPSLASMADLPPATPNIGAAAFPPVPNLGIRTSTQDGDAIMGNAATAPQALLAHASTAMDVDVGPTTTLVKDKVEERATAELYS